MGAPNINSDQLWSISDVAAYFNVSTRHAMDRIVCHPSFPKRVRIPTLQGLSQPRWKKHEVLDYVDYCQKEYG